MRPRTYERQAIVHWVQNNGDSPITRKPLGIDQLRDNNAVLNVLLLESEKPDDVMHPCIRRWKEELSSPPPSIVPEQNTLDAQNDRAMQGIAMNGAIVPVNINQQSPQYPTTHEEMQERMGREHRISMISLVITIVIISFALVYLPFYLVLFALAMFSCLYARRRFHERHRSRR